MNAAMRTNRSRRGRVLIVGDIPEIDRLLGRVELTSGPPLRVTNLFEALGEIATGSASAPIATVILCDRNMPLHANRAIESMHKLDPSLRVVMMNANGGTGVESRDWAKLGADDCVSMPATIDDFCSIIDEDLLAGGLSLDEAATGMESPPPAYEPPPRLVSTSSVDPPSASVHEIPDDVPVTPVQTPAAPAPPLRVESEPPSARSAPTSSQLLGDTDLVESVLAGGDRLAATALQLMAQQTGWGDLALSDEHTPNAAPVSFIDQHFGFLSTAHAKPDQLQPWADWLARWLALGHSYHTYRLQSMQDELTGAGNRRYFDDFLSESIKGAARVRRQVTLMVFDIDNFKLYNDEFGHDAGDDILRETVRLMQSVIRQGDRVCRIGGDEFAVIFADEEAPREPGSRHPETVESIAKRFQDQICKMRFPKLASEAPGTLTISAGLATYPWDGADPDALLRHADQLALESKRKGKNVITFGQGALRACRPEH